jgi:DNA-binding IscR family transcriptional regulator
MTIFPIFLVWIYLSWVITLIGGTTSYIHQKYKIIWGFNKEFILGAKNKTTEVLTNEKLIEIFYIVSAKYSLGKGSTHLDEISQYFKIQPEVISYIIERWVESNLIISYEDRYISYIPKKPLGLITLGDILNPFLNEINLVDASKHFNTFINEYRTISKTYINDRSIQDLI